LRQTLAESRPFLSSGIMSSPDDKVLDIVGHFCLMWKKLKIKLILRTEDGGELVRERPFVLLKIFAYSYVSNVNSRIFQFVS
jgi:hypothetical protein